MRAIKKVAAVVLAVLFIAAAVTGCGSKDKLRIGTAGEGGNYNAMGHPSNRPHAGINIVETRYSNGTRKIEKIVK